MNCTIMAITLDKVSQQEINNFLKLELEAMDQAIIRTLSYCGEQCRNIAVSRPSPPKEMAGKPHKPNYIDWSTNLRSSIGYVIVQDGRIRVRTGFEAVSAEGERGSKAGLSFAEKIAKGFPKGYCLIVVAGMEYATYVHNKGYDVLDSAELEAERIVPGLMKQLRF